MHVLGNCFTKLMVFRISGQDVQWTNRCTKAHIQLIDGSTAGNLRVYFVYHKNTFKKLTACQNVSDFCYAYFQVLCCTLNWSRLHNFIHDILLWAKTFRLVAQCLNQLRHRVPLSCVYVIKNLTFTGRCRLKLWNNASIFRRWQQRLPALLTVKCCSVLHIPWRSQQRFPTKLCL